MLPVSNGYRKDFGTLICTEAAICIYNKTDILFLCKRIILIEDAGEAG